jgi:type I restriction enzyme S subunit
VPQLDNAAKTKDGDNRKLVKAGDFVINSRSDRKGSSGVSNLDGSVSLINIVLEPKSIHPKFCHHLLKSYIFTEEYYRVGRGIVADLWTTRYDEMRTITLAIPSMEEQTLIANFLDQKTAQIDEAIAIKEQQIVLLKERKQIIIQKAVTQGLDPDVLMKDSGVDWIGEIPADWVVKRLKQVSFIQNGQVDPKSIQFRKEVLIAPNHIESGTGKILYKETAEEQGAESGKYPVKKGALLYSKIRPELRKACIAEENGMCSADMYAINPIDDVYPMFLLLVFLGEKFTGYMVNQSMRVAMPKVNRNDVENYWLAIPPLINQKQIIEEVEIESLKIDDAIDGLHKQVSTLKEYKTTLINSAVTGKIRITPEMVA